MNKSAAKNFPKKGGTSDADMSFISFSYNHHQFSFLRRNITFTNPKVYSAIMIKILLIEDNEEILENTTEILRLANYEVTTAKNGKTGYEQALKSSPDLIICDIMMPELDGYGFLYLKNKNEQLQRTPFIFLTAKTDRKDLRKAMEMGADDYITKPFTELELLDAIEIRLQKINYYRENTFTKGDNLSFNQINDNKAITLLTDSGDIMNYPKNQQVYTEGNYPHCLYYIHAGKARAYRTSDSGKELTTTLYKPGDFLGYKALLGETAYKESTETLEDSEIGIIKKEKFNQLMYEHKAIARQFVKILTNNITEKEDQLIGLAYYSLRKRVANTILRLLKKYKAENQDEFIIHISRENMAQMVGTATESLIRTLSDFKNENLIETKAGMVKVLDKDKLQQMVN